MAFIVHDQDPRRTPGASEKTAFLIRGHLHGSIPRLRFS
jgi:hypothetical protein